MKTYTINKFDDAVTLCSFGHRLIRVTRKNHHRLYVFEETETLVATLAKMSVKEFTMVDHETRATAEKLVRSARIPPVRSVRRPPVTRQVLIAKGLVKPAPKVAKPAPASIIKSEPVSKIAPEIPKELTPAEFNKLVAQTMKPKPVAGLKLRNKIAAPKPAPKKVQLPPGATFNPFANLRDLLVTP